MSGSKKPVTCPSTRPSPSTSHSKANTASSTKNYKTPTSKSSHSPTSTKTTPKAISRINLRSSYILMASSFQPSMIWPLARPTSSNSLDHRAAASSWASTWRTTSSESSRSTNSSGIWSRICQMVRKKMPETSRNSLLKESIMRRLESRRRRSGRHDSRLNTALGLRAISGSSQHPRTSEATRTRTFSFGPSNGPKRKKWKIHEREKKEK